MLMSPKLSDNICCQLDRVSREVHICEDILGRVTGSYAQKSGGNIMGRTRKVGAVCTFKPVSWWVLTY
jgi:hypothetical protein